MADAPSADHPPDPTSNGASNGRREPSAATDAPTDEQSRGDLEQTLVDSDQTGGTPPVRRTGVEWGDQTGADSDQVSADRDQAASDRDLTRGVNKDDHAVTRDIREHSTHARGQTTAARMQIASKRDDGARARDHAALLRDHTADGRDLEMARRDAAHHRAFGQRSVTGADIILRAADERARAKHRALAAQHRSETAENRSMAAEDREAAACDREQAACDLAQALTERDALAAQLTVAETDALTGVRTRGLVDLDRELSRCRRTGAALVVCYIDVVGLKARNDSAGHHAGDELLKRVVGTVRSHLRAYDLIIRLGGDEFLCAMSDMSLTDARQRLGRVSDALGASVHSGAIRVGFAQLTPEDSAAQLIARADGELLRHRG